MRPLKVLQLLPALDSGGVERGTLEIARALVAAGHESVVLSKGGRLVDQLQREGSRHLALDLGRKSPATLLHYRALRRLFEAERFDIVHARSRLPAWVAWLAWRGMPASARPHFVTTVHGMHSVSRYSAIMCAGERVIAVSDTVRDYIRTNYPSSRWPHLADELAVGALHADLGVLLDGDLDLRGDGVVDGVGVAEGEVQGGALDGGLEADALDLELLGEALAHAPHHVVQHGASQAVEGLGLGGVVGAPDDEL